MKKKCLILLVSIFCCGLTFAQDIGADTYSVIGINDSLKKEANAVVRLDEGILEVSTPSRYTLKQHQIITILNKQGANHLYHSFNFDKFSKIHDIEIRVLNELGFEVKKYKKKDFEIQSAYDGMSLVTDDKVMKLFTPAPGFPCTVEIRSEMSVTSYLELPNSYVNTNKESTELFRYLVKVPIELDIRYRARNFELKPSITTEGNQKTYLWESKNLPAKKMESDNYENPHHLLQIEVAPNQFEYDGYRGQFKSWKEFGQWCYALYEQKDIPFTDQRITEIKTLASAEPDLKNKVASLYDYLKKNMRYVSIQLGIGGFKPFSVRFVDEKKYGDCKALTNYMRNMLTVAGIKSYPALINAGYNKSPADPAFPSSPFNHVILCIPNEKDSIWLECTSNYDVAGFLGSSTENKNALLLTEAGGILVSTPRSDCGNNKLNVRTDIFLDKDGGAEVSSSIYSTGDELSLYNYLKQLGVDRQKEILVKHMNYRLPDDFEINTVRDSASGLISNYKFSYEKLYDFNAGNKYFFQQRINKFIDEDIAVNDGRKTEYLFEHPYDKRDTTIFHLPQGITVDNLPPVLELKNEFATYKNEILFDKVSNIISVHAHLLLKKNIIQPNEYNELATFFQSANRHQGQKIILKKE